MAEKYQWKSADSPAPRLASTLSYDASRQRLVMFGGKSVSGVLNDTWEWDGTLWAPRSVALPPPGRFAALSFFDPLAQRVVMHGGATSSTTYNDSWEWNGSSWRVVPTPGGAPPLRAFSTGALDTKRNAFVLFGGLDVNGVVLSDTWEFNLATRTWAKKTPATTPPGRQFSAMAFDSDREKMVMMGGLNLGTANQVLNDTWEYDGVDWTKRSPATSPSPRGFARAVYDASRGKILMYGGSSGSGAGGLSSDFKNELWEWDGTNWRQLDAEKPPVAAALGIGFGFDGKNVVLAGTSTEGSALLLTQKTDVCTTTADCLSGSYCVDGVCCQSTACNACETCNGATPGICTPIVNKEDADSCAGGKSCSDKAVCLEAIGAECTDGTTCASGNCVDGVCCDSACDGTCVACRDSLKQENSRNGLCGPAKTGVTEAACTPSEASTCGQDGTCDGRGSCAKYAKGTVCGTDFTCTTQSIASGRVCDGLGVCSSDASPIDCLGFQCVSGTGCKLSCLPVSSTADCASGFRCSSGLCKPAATSACADTNNEYVDDVNTKSCGNYVCRERCLTSCGTVDDCAAGSVCDFESRCVPVPAIDTEGALGLFGCSQSPGNRPNGFVWAALGGIGLLLARGVGRRRRD